MLTGNCYASAMDLAPFRSFDVAQPPVDARPDVLVTPVPSEAELRATVARFMAEQDRQDLPLVHPDRRPTRMNWRSAVKHFLVLKHDKERARESFHVFEALPWVGMVDAVCKFLASEQGKAIYASEPFLPTILDDHAALRRLPQGSLAHAYCDHMEREELSAAGLMAEYEEWRGGRVRLDDKVEWYADRLRDTHDLLHVLTGFDRDVLAQAGIERAEIGRASCRERVSSPV